MAIKLITGTTGSAHITPMQDSMWHRALQGVSDCILDFGNNMSAEIQTNNVVRIKDGIASVQGRYVCIEPNAYEDVTIDNGSQGNNRIDVICIKITVNAGGTQSASLVAIKGTPTSSTPAEPAIPEGSLDDGDTEVYMPLALVTLSGISIDSVTRKAVKLSETALGRTLDSVLCSDVLEFAEGCQKGITSFYTGEATTNIPSAFYRYSSGFVHRRGPEQITVFLYAYNSNIIAVNTYFAGNWTGWSTLADIVAEYETDNWHVIKWANGEAEARMMSLESSGTLSGMTAIGNVYYSANKTRALPSGLFVDNNYHVSVENQTSGGPLGIYRQSSSTKDSFVYRVQKANNSSTSADFKLNVKGRWK